MLFAHFPSYFEQVKDARWLLEGIRFSKLIQLGQSSLQVAICTQTDAHRHSLRDADDRNLESDYKPVQQHRKWHEFCTKEYCQVTVPGTSLSTASLCRAARRTSCSCFLTRSLLKQCWRVTPIHRYRKLYKKEKRLII